MLRYESVNRIRFQSQVVIHVAATLRLGCLCPQATNPLYFYQRFWNSEVAFQYRCMIEHDKIMRQKVQRLMKEPPADYTIAAHLLSVKDPATGKPLTPRQLRAEIAIFMAAGFETTSHVSML
eukprot:GHUV01039103.1.p1 GENE.GHUV01039103.1~~GHUV01039103.1.p1  ORF type:complete len:122 (+),score=16.88 GHUV01039103.1:851-1216(+)